MLLSCQWLKWISKFDCDCVCLVVITDEQVQEHYDEFFEEIFVELEDKVNVASILWSLLL